MLLNTKKEAFAMLKTNFKKLLAVALLGTMGLAGCSNEVQAKPTGYDDNLLTFSENDNIYHNLVSLVEDAYRDGSLASDVLDQVLYQYAVSVFGRYNKIAKPYNLGEGEITLKEAAKDIEQHSTYTDGVRSTSGATKAEEFINKFKAYQSLDNDGNRKTEAADKQSEFDRVMAKWQTIEDRIAINLYNDIIGGSYSERGVFSEKKFLISLRSGLNKVANPYTLEADKMHEVVFTPDVEDKEVFDATDGYLNRENYQTKAAWSLEGDDEDVETAVIRYVEDELIPIIYRTLLVEQYLLDESYNTLGRSYARKVNVLAIAKNDYNTYLMQDFVRNDISVKKTDTNEVTLNVFNNISAINVGLRDKIEEITGYEFGSADAQSIMAEFGYQYVAESVAGAKDDYYLGTDYGDMMQEYRKITDDILTTDTSAESSFTGSYTYSKEIGKEIKENELANKDYTQNGWYIKNGGLSDLPDEIRTRLYNIGVANALDDEDYPDRNYQNDTAADWDVNYTIPEGEGNYVAKINGKYYLKVGSKEAGADPRDDILFKINGTSYVIQIEEAISASKLSKESTVYDSTIKEEIINEVAKVIASDDSYKTLSTKHWLEKCALKYHDQVVYDYFKTNYPELFEDD